MALIYQNSLYIFPEVCEKENKLVSNNNFVINATPTTSGTKASDAVTPGKILIFEQKKSNYLPALIGILTTTEESIIVEVTFSILGTHKVTVNLGEKPTEVSKVNIYRMQLLNKTGCSFPNLSTSRY